MDRITATTNIGIAKQVYQWFLSRDFDNVLKVLSSDVEWGEPANPYNPAGGTRYGHQGFLDWLQIGNEAEEILDLQLYDFLSNDQLVAVTGYTKCLARATGKTYETEFVHLFTFKAGKIVRFREFFDTWIAAEAFRH